MPDLDVSFYLLSTYINIYTRSGLSCVTNSLKKESKNDIKYTDTSVNTGYDSCSITST